MEKVIQRLQHGLLSGHTHQEYLIYVDCSICTSALILIFAHMLNRTLTKVLPNSWIIDFVYLLVKETPLIKELSYYYDWSCTRQTLWSDASSGTKDLCQSRRNIKPKPSWDLGEPSLPPPTLLYYVVRSTIQRGKSTNIWMHHRISIEPLVFIPRECFLRRLHSLEFPTDMMWTCMDCITKCWDELGVQGGYQR